MCLSVACAATSFFGGFAIFSILGNMAHIMGKTVDEVVKSGYFKKFYLIKTI